MDNEKQVNQLVEQSKAVFLREVLEDFKRGQAQYDLETEFAKTKKNRNIMIPLVIALVGIFFIAGSVAVTLYIENSARKVQVNINFEDLNLRDVLDTAKRLEKERGNTERELDGLQSELGRAIDAIRQKFNQRRGLLRADQLSSEDLEDEVRALNRQEATEIAEVTRQYAARQAEKRAQLADIQKKIDEYDTRALEQAREQESRLNAQQQLFSLELEKTTKIYEDRIAEMERSRSVEQASQKKYEQELVNRLKAQHQREIAALVLLYNPLFNSEALQADITAALGEGLSADAVSPNYRSILEQRGIRSRNAFQSMSEALRRYQALFSAIKSIPFKNGVPGALGQMDTTFRSVVNFYETLWNKIADTLQIESDALALSRAEAEGFRYAMDQLVKNSRENGYVLDPRDPAKISVFISSLRNVADGTSAIVFRKDDQFVARVRFRKENGQVYATITEPADGSNPLEPFDRIIIQEVQEQAR